MGRHSEWRKQAKKFRRKRIRQALATEREQKLKEEREKREKSPRYIQWLAEQETIRQFEEEEEKRIAQEEERRWLEREKENRKQWEELQIKLAHIKEERRKQEERIQQEWEEEQRILREAKEKKEKEQKEKERFEELFQKQIEEYVSNGGKLPEELKTNMETNPGKQICPFFTKVGVCRFGDGCSRNHVRPRVSTILLFHSFYTHISLEQSESEYGSDSNLEYDDRDTHHHFCEFFDDVLPELQKCGCIVQFRVCCNKEIHLRGNVYVEYMSPQDAIRAYRAFQGRWYGGRQLNVEFCSIGSWKSAICGLNFKKRCPKGSSCNFLHVFRNPGRMFEDVNFSARSTREERYFEQTESPKNWRWSVSPERDIQKEENGYKRRRRTSDEYKSRERSRERKRYSSRSKRSRSPSYPKKVNRTKERTKSYDSKERRKSSKY